MCLKSIQVFLLCIWISLGSTAQTIEGKITENGTPVVSASILVKIPTNYDNIVQYTVSDFDGNYHIELKEPFDTILLEVLSLAHEPKIIPLKELKKKKSPITFNIELSPRMTSLKEVEVKVEKRPIIIKKDTVSYNPNRFKDGTEKVVEDLLKKLPGIEVEQDGRIRYNGKLISKFLLEGDDLFGQGYTIGSRNIDVGMVEEIQAIENFIGNPLLRGIKSTDDVAINLTLKKGKTDFSGNAEVGYGVLDRYLVRTTGLAISKNFKGFANFQFNNVGQNQTPYDFTNNKISIEEKDEKNFISPKLISEGFFKQHQSDQNRRINNTFYTGINSLYKLSKKMTLHINAGYYFDKLLQTSTNQIIYDEVVGISDQNEIENLSKRPRLFNATVVLDSYLSETVKLEYEGKIRFQNTNTDNNAFNNTTPIDNSISTISRFTKHKLLLTQQLNLKNVFQYQGLFSYSEAPQEYIISPGFNFNEGIINTSASNRQLSQFQDQYVNAHMTWFNVNRIGKLDVSIGYNNNQNNFVSEITESGGTALGDNFKNDFRYHTSKSYIRGNFDYRNGKWRFKTKIEFSSFDLDYQEKNLGTEEISSQFVINPSLNISYATGQYSTLFSSYNYNQTTPNETYLFQNPVLTGFRQIQSNTFNLEFLNNHSFIVGYVDNDLYNLFRLNIFLSGSIDDNSYFSNPEINQDITFTNRFLLGKGRENYNATFSVSDYLRFIRTTYSLSSNYSISRFKNIVSGSDLRNNQNNNWSNSLYLRTGFKGKLNLENKVSVSVSTFFSDGNKSNDFIVAENRAKLIYGVSEKLLFVLENYYSTPTETSQENVFLDASLEFTPKDKLTFRLEAKNLTNNNRVETVSINDFSRSTQSYNLLERYVLLSVNFRF